MVGMLVGAIVAAGETSSPEIKPFHARQLFTSDETESVMYTHLEQGIISSSLALQELWLGKSILS